jgi:hypothetical protein
MLSTKFRFIWPCGFRREDFLKSTNQKQELSVAAMFVNGSELKILVSNWLISKKSSPLKPLGRKHPWKVLYKDCSFSSDPLTNMAATGNSDSFGQAVTEEKLF